MYSISSAQFANLHNFEIALRKLEIAKLEANFEIGIQFRNCPPIYPRNFEIALRKLEIVKLETNFEVGILFRNCAQLCAISKFTQFQNCEIGIGF